MHAVEDTTKEPLDISVTTTHESAPSRERRGLPRQSAILWTQTLTGLAVAELVAMRRQLRVLAAGLEQEVTARLLAGFQGDDCLGAVAVLAPARLAELWSMPVAKIRELCRTGRIPGKKSGNKERAVPLTALHVALAIATGSAQA